MLQVYKRLHKALECVINSLEFTNIGQPFVFLIARRINILEQANERLTLNKARTLRSRLLQLPTAR